MNWVAFALKVGPGGSDYHVGRGRGSGLHHGNMPTCHLRITYIYRRVCIALPPLDLVIRVICGSSLSYETLTLQSAPHPLHWRVHFETIGSDRNKRLSGWVHRAE